VVEFRTLLGTLVDGDIEFILVGGVAATVPYLRSQPRPGTVRTRL